MAFPEAAAEVRDEVRAVLAKHNGDFTSAALHAMEKLDSFLKETMRHHPVSLGGCRHTSVAPSCHQDR